MIDPQRIKKEFTLLRETDLVYLDNAATTLTPDRVVDAMSEYYKRYRATINRGSYRLSNIASEKYETARQNISELIGAGEDEVVFTRGTTDSINLLAYSLRDKVDVESEIIVTDMEHHSNFLPWLNLSQRVGCKLVVVEAVDGKYSAESILEKVNENTKIIALHHVSNVLGDVIDVETICNNVPDGIYTIIDGAQAIAHERINVKRIGCTFYVFSSHKMYGPTGLGVTYIRSDIQKELDPFEYGGDMVDSTTVDLTDYETKSGVSKFEAGSPSVAEVIGLGEAVRFMKEIGIDNIHRYEQELKRYAVEAFTKIQDKVEVYNADNSSSLLTFNILGVAVHDAISASMLNDVTFDEVNIAIREGKLCNNLAMKYVLNKSAVLRVSFAAYNTREDIDKLVAQVEKIYNVWNPEPVQ